MSKLGFFNEEDKNDNQKIEIELDQQRYIMFKGALAVLGQNEREAFEDFIAYTFARANKKLSGDNSFETTFNNGVTPVFNTEQSNHLSEDVIRNRIYKWARNEKGYPHLMVKAFFKASLFPDEVRAWRSKMQVCFDDLTSSEPSDSRFITTFRQMCSDSSRAYGNVFIYDNARELVYLNEKYKDLIIELREQFLY